MGFDSEVKINRPSILVSTIEENEAVIKWLKSNFPQDVIGYAAASNDDIDRFNVWQYVYGNWTRLLKRTSNPVIVKASELLYLATTSETTLSPPKLKGCGCGLTYYENGQLKRFPGEHSPSCLEANKEEII